MRQRLGWWGRRRCSCCHPAGWFRGRQEQEPFSVAARPSGRVHGGARWPGVARGGGRPAAEGRAFVLLDGVDEVPQSSARALVVRAVDRFRTNHESNRVLVTFAPSGLRPGCRRHPPLHSSQLLDGAGGRFRSPLAAWARELITSLDARPAKGGKGRRDKGAQGIIPEQPESHRACHQSFDTGHRLTRFAAKAAGCRISGCNFTSGLSRPWMDTWNQFRSLSDQSIGGQALPVDRLIRVWGSIAAWSRATRPTGRDAPGRTPARIGENSERDGIRRGRASGGHRRELPRGGLP